MRAPKRALGLFAIALVVALAFFIVPAVTDSGKKASAEWPYTLIYYDGHMHTDRSDGTGSVAQIKETALARDLDAVIITDHCKDMTRAEWQSLVAETAAASTRSFLALPAFEITGEDGLMRDHFLAYNVPDPFVGDDALEQCPEEEWPSPPNPAGTGPLYPENLTKWADYIHSQGGIAVHNHTTGSTQLSYGVNDIEVYNQGLVDDISAIGRKLGYPPEQAWGLAMTLNNLAIYGEAGAPMWFKQLVYWATQFVPPYYTSQWIGAPLAARLNSWDELLMAYVNGTVDTPIFAVANTDAHNTNHMDKDNDKLEGEDGIDGIDNDGDTLVDEDPPGGQPLDSNVGVAKNGLYVLALTPRQVYKAIEAGRSFATTGPSLAVDVNGVPMGGTAYVPKGGSANLNLSVKAETPGFILAKIDLIKNGQPPQTIYPIDLTLRSQWEVTLPDTVTARGYYRVEVTAVDMATGAHQFAYSNPVFVKCPFDKDCDGYLDLIEKLLGSNPNDPTSTPESIFVPGTCKDTVDNDGDTLIDRADPGCRW